MTSTFKHQYFDLPHRDSQSLSNDRCQNILYKAVFEHVTKIKDITVLLLTSKSFQNSSFGANFLVNFVVAYDSIDLLDSILTPSSCFSMQFVPSLYIKQWRGNFEKTNGCFDNFVSGMLNKKYFRSSLRSLTLDFVKGNVKSSFFGSSTSNSWPQLQDLSLSECDVNDDILEIIAKNALQLRSLNLVGNSEITDVGLEHLSKLSGITSLDLSFCDLITDVGIEYISNFPGITSLNLLRCNLMTDASVELISTLSNITSLNLSNCEYITNAGFEHLSKLTGITSLVLGGSDKITDSTLEHVAKLSGIKSLNLGHSEVGDVGLEHISKLSKITSLDLYYCLKVTDAGLEFVARLSNITSLNLSYCSLISDAGLEHLSKLSGLTSVDLYSCDKTSDGARKKFNPNSCIED